MVAIAVAVAVVGLVAFVTGILLVAEGLHELVKELRRRRDPNATAEMPPILAEPKRAVYWRSSR